MKEAPQMAEKQIPPALNKKAVNSSKRSRETTSQEMEPCTSQEKSSTKKKTCNAPTLKSADVFDVATAGASIEISELLAKFAEVLREKAAADTSRMEELECILTEARNLEAHLIEKKKHLRQTLALISEKLLG